VDGLLATDLGLEGTAARLRGPAGSRVLVRLRLAQGSEREVELERREVAIKPVRERLLEQGGHRLGYVRISQFSEPVPLQLRDALAGFERSGVEGVILDLRNNSGGLVAAGLASADDLLDGQPIVATVDRDGMVSPQQANPGSLYGGPLVTLVNGGTASASEILAGALQDDGRSPLLGSRTFGKGLIQTLIGLGNGSGLAVTVAATPPPAVATSRTWALRPTNCWRAPNRSIQAAAMIPGWRPPPPTWWPAWMRSSPTRPAGHESADLPRSPPWGDPARSRPACRGPGHGPDRHGPLPAAASHPPVGAGLSHLPWGRIEPLHPFARVLHLARQAFDGLVALKPALEEHRGVLLAAALLHDVGHGPLSHSGEEMYGLRHEAWSGRLVRQHPALRDRLEAYAPGTAAAVADLLAQGHHREPAIKALVSSQLDCDRLDYLLRDSYSTGTRFGQLDLERILAALTLAPDGQIAIHPKGLMAVEHYLVVRNLMYRSVYNHRLNMVCNWLLSQTVATARRLGPGQVEADAVMARWLWQPEQLGDDDFLANDDLRTGYHLLRWREQGPAGLRTLCGRLLDRRLLKASDVSGLAPAQRLELLALARRLCQAQGLEAELHCGLHQLQSRGYHPYKGGLRLWDGRNLSALEQSSALVRSLIQPVQIAWLIHPSEVSGPLRATLAEALRQAERAT
jgi:hypothetical protein